MTDTFRYEFKKLMQLAIPIMAGGAVNSIMPFMNTVYLAHLGEVPLAAGGLALSIFVFLMVMFWGMLSTMSALIARYRGAGEMDKVGELTRTTLLFALLMSFPIIAVFHVVDLVLAYMNFSPNLVIEVKRFFVTMSFAAPADLMLTTLYALCFGLSRPRYVMIVTLCQVPINLFLNHVFMFGDFAMPKFGVAGIGVGVACTYWVMLVVLFILLSRAKEFRHHLWGSTRLNFHELWGLLKVGGPAGLQWVLEMGFFSMIALMMGQLSVMALAAYQVVFQIYNLFFNFVYNFNQAVTIRVADGLGAKKLKQVKYSYLSSYVFIAVMILIQLVLIVFFKEPLIHLFTKPDVVSAPGFLNLCRDFLILMPIFAILDFLGYTHFEVLRAFKDSAFPMLVAFVVYWLFAVPLTYIAVHFWHVAPFGLWLVMIVASALSLSGQSLRYRYQYLRFKSELTTSRSS